MARGRLRVGLLSFALVLASQRAHAQETDSARAQALFERGVVLMDESRFDEACPMLEESQRLESAGGTVLNLAYCYERAGKLVAAASGYREAERIADSDGRADRR